jgi:hypothetical protein
MTRPPRPPTIPAAPAQPPPRGRGNLPHGQYQPPAEQYPLAIVVDHATHQRWQRFKQQVNRSRDRAAFLELLRLAEAAGLLPGEETP